MDLVQEQNEIELNIERVGALGEGVAKDLEGNVYFVEGAIPGDRVSVRYPDVSKRFRNAVLQEVLVASPQRIEPVCPVFGECGGCDWLHWDYPSQLSAKDSMMRHMLSKNGVEAEKYLPIQPSPKPLGYRNRIQVRIEDGKVGFYKKKSHEMVPIDHCPVAHPSLNEMLGTLKRETGARRKVELVVEKDGHVGVYEDKVHPTSGFAQINEEQNQFLQNRVKEFITEVGAQQVLELYAGNGNLTFAAAERTKNWMAIEINAASVEEGRRTRESRNLPQVTFFKMEVDKRLLAKLPEEFCAQCDTLILDPPRDGAHGLLGQFVKTSIQNILYISCSPISFSRDAQDLKKAFRLVSVQAVDMFPQTRHVELIAHFTRVSK